jgi:S-adenosyl methyltransferase
MAQRVSPDARVVYIDNDPVVWSHGQALLAHGDQVAMVRAGRVCRQASAQLHLRPLAGIRRFLAGLRPARPGGGLDKRLATRSGLPVRGAAPVTAWRRRPHALTSGVLT